MNAPRIDLKLVGAAGDRYRKAKAEADAALEAIVDEVLRVREAGSQANIKAAAKVAGVERSTIYSRLKRRTERTTP